MAAIVRLALLRPYTFVVMSILILIFGEALALYGLIVSLILTSQ